MSAVASSVQQREGELFVGDSQVTLESVVATWQREVIPRRDGARGHSWPAHGA